MKIIETKGNQKMMNRENAKVLSCNINHDYRYNILISKQSMVSLQNFSYLCIIM